MDDGTLLKIDGKVAIIPAFYRWSADGAMLLQRLAMPAQYRLFAVTALRPVSLVVAADWNRHGIGVCGDAGQAKADKRRSG